MNWRSYLILFIIGFGIFTFVSIFQQSPGYMDADYYLAGGIRLAGGYGFNEEIIWNYLDDPSGIPHPSHAYWMPAASLLAALGMKVFGVKDFFAAQIPFILIAALIPPLTAALSFSILHKRSLAILAGLFALLPGFYLPFLSTSDTFGFYMLFGGAFFIIVGLKWDPPQKFLGISILLGLLAGFMHFTRAEGILWFGLSLLVVGIKVYNEQRPLHLFRRLSLGIVFCAIGYLIVMGPWMLRSMNLFDAPFAPGGSRAFWITSYDELYTYPAKILTVQRWLESGFRQILEARLWAAGQNLQSALAVQGVIILAPCILIGLWQRRMDLRVRIGVLAWLLIFIIMTFIFPFQGARGGFFHAMAALQPLYWSVAPLGLERAINWIGERRNWNLAQAQAFLRIGLLGLLCLLTILVTVNRIWESEGNQSAWNKSFKHYLQVEKSLQEWGASAGELVLVSNAPGYYIANQRPAFSIPYGNLTTTLNLMQHYNVSYLILEIDQIQGEQSIYDQPGNQPGLDYLGTIEKTHIFRVDKP